MEIPFKKQGWIYQEPNVLNISCPFIKVHQGGAGMESFTENEKAILSGFCTNTDLDCFALVNLPEAVKGALFSRYSRSPKSLRRVLLDEFILNPETGFDAIAGHADESGE